MIQIKPKTVECQNYWMSKIEGVIFVEKESDIEILFDALVKQDDYWKSYKRLIKVAPKEIDSENDLKSYCQYVGKTDIWKPEELRQIVNFTIFQYRDNCCCY